MKATMPNLDREKMQQVILFFLERINNVYLGRTKLMKLLYYVDFDHYEKYGRSITCATYRKLPHGPVPDKAEKVIEEMEKKGLVKRIVEKDSIYTQHRLITIKGKFDPSKFTGDEITILEAVACHWRDATAAEIEAASHAEAPWASTQDSKAIDYELAQYRTPLPTDEVDECLVSSKSFAKYVEALATH